jgi:phospholipase C
MRSNSTRTYKLLCGVALCAMAINAITPIAAAAQAAAEAAGENGSNDANTTTPIKHVIVIIGENHTFDHLFATYQPAKKGETLFNLSSEGIVNADGTPGPHYSAATQYQATDTAAQGYLNSPPKTRPYSTLPPPLASGGYEIGGIQGLPPFSKVAQALTYENGLPPAYYKYLTTGAIPPYCTVSRTCGFTMTATPSPVCPRDLTS